MEELQAAIYGEDVGMAAQEETGAIVAMRSPVYAFDDVNYLFERERWSFARRRLPEYIFIYVDPNGGGSSYLCVLTMTLASVRDPDTHLDRIQIILLVRWGAAPPSPHHR